MWYIAKKVLYSSDSSLGSRWGRAWGGTARAQSRWQGRQGPASLTQCARRILPRACRALGPGPGHYIMVTVHSTKKSAI